MTPRSGWIAPLLVSAGLLALALPAARPLEEVRARLPAAWDPAATGLAQGGGPGWTLPPGEYRLEAATPEGSARRVGIDSAGGLIRIPPRPLGEGLGFTLPVRTRGIRPATDGPLPALRIRQLRDGPGLGLPGWQRPGWHQEPIGPAEPPDLWIYLPTEVTYRREGDGFWLQGDRAARIRLLSRRRLRRLELRVHSLAEVDLACPDCPLAPERHLAPHREERLLVRPRPLGSSGGLHLAELRLACRGGGRPADRDPRSPDRRFLGVHCRLPRPGDALWLADRLLAAGRPGEAREELLRSDHPLARTALDRLGPRALAPGPVLPVPERAGELPELGILWNQPGDRSLRSGPGEPEGPPGEGEDRPRRFGGLELRSAGLEPPEVPPGRETVLELRLRSPRPDRIDPILKVHALPAGPPRLSHAWWRLRNRLGWGRPGLVVGDHRPAPGVGPPWTWLPGETVRDRVSLRIPPGAVRGDYLVRVSVRERVGGAGIPEDGTRRGWVTVARFRVR